MEHSSLHLHRNLVGFALEDFTFADRRLHTGSDAHVCRHVARAGFLRREIQCETALLPGAVFCRKARRGSQIPPMEGRCGMRTPRGYENEGERMGFGFWAIRMARARVRYLGQV